VLSEEIPEIPDADRMKIAKLSQGFYRITARYGFMESTDVPRLLARAASEGVENKPLDTTFYLGREQLIPTGPTPLWTWRKKLFVIMSRNARSATAFYHIPPNRVVELGAQIEF
jgi:KUP system potassium uptake protein